VGCGDADEEGAGDDEGSEDLHARTVRDDAGALQARSP
jgi:hypothetical protein